MTDGFEVASKRVTPVERRSPAVWNVSDHKEGKDEMTKASIDLQDLRRRIYVKAKAETSWKFWGLYVHVCKLETLREAYALAKKNDGAPGSDGVTFEAIEAQGVEAFLGQIADELVRRSYVPLQARRQEIPKDGGKVRVLSIPAIRDRVVQGALKLILEPIFEADFPPGSFGYRPKRTAHEAVDRVARAIVQRKTRVIDIDLRSYFDNVRHNRLLAKVAQRVDDADVMHLLKIMLKAGGKQGVPQGGVISPLLSNIYLTEVDRMLERAKEASRDGKYTYVEYARFADDLVILIDAYKRHDWLMAAVEKRLREELAELQVEINEEKSSDRGPRPRRKLRLSGVRLPRQRRLDFGRGKVAIRRAIAKAAQLSGRGLRELMNSKVTVTEQGRTRRISRLDVMLRQLTNDAMRGDQRALKLLMEFLHRYGAEVEGTVRSEDITSEDLEILSDYLRKTGSSNSDPDLSPKGEEDDGESL